MYKHRIASWMKLSNVKLLWTLILLCPITLHASFIESTVGTAVVNDATATYYNPAALTLLPNTQIITLGSAAYYSSKFTGQSTQSATGFTQLGNTSTKTQYYIPTLYIGMPINTKITAGLAVIENTFGRNIDGNSMLRYDLASNNVLGVDIVPALGLKINEQLSIGAGLALTYANFLMKPIYGFPSLNIPDSESRNECKGTGIGGDIGILLKPSLSTLIGFNYHSSVTYRLSGRSTLESNPEFISNDYRFNFWTPARSTISANQFITPSLGLITTIQYIQWNIFKNVDIHGIAVQAGKQPKIVDANAPYHLHNSWLFTLGSYYRLSPKWIVRVASTYNQSPGNADYQLSNGDSLILGASLGYELNKTLSIDGSYAHAFIANENIHITTGRNIIVGTNQGSRDAISVKLTFNV